MNYYVGVFCVLAFTVSPRVGFASLIGDTVRMVVPATGFAEDFVVQDGPERFFRGNVLDFQAESIVYTFTVNSRFVSSTSHHFLGLDWINSEGIPLSAQIDGVDVDSTLDFDASRITFDSSSIIIDWSDVQFEASDVATFHLTVSNIPEPTSCSLLLFTTVFIAMGGRRTSCDRQKRLTSQVLLRRMLPASSSTV
jgi:hypothetical protein